MGDASGRPRVLVIGMGNRQRGDDAVGLLVAEAVGSAAPPGVAVHCHEGDGADLLEIWEGVPCVIVVDAMQAGDSPGSVRRFEAHDTPLAADSFHYSSHAFGLAEGIETARAIEMLPKTVLVYGIEGVHFQGGASCSPRVEGVIPSLTDRILGEAVALARAQDEVPTCTN